VSDGVGGALVVWVDGRSGEADLYAQHLTASGGYAPGWSGQGVAVCIERGAQQQPSLCSDGAGGALAVWQDYRGGATGDLYAQHITAGGELAWATGGVPVCVDSVDQCSPAVASDGAGGALIIWQDARGDGADLYSAPLSAAGTLLGLGVPLVAAIGPQRNPHLLPDGAGSVFLVWEDGRGGDLDLYALRLAGNGTPLGGWPGSGLAITIRTGDQFLPVLARDGAPAGGGSGAIVAWCDRSEGRADIRAQRVSADGVLLWPDTSAVVCNAGPEQYAPAIVADSSGGAIVAWEDYRNGRSDLYAQHLAADGSRSWAPDGVALCRMPGDQFDVALASDHAGGALATWSDAARPARAGFLGRRPILTGPIPTLSGVETGPGRAKLVYQTEANDRRALTFERRLANESWQLLGLVRGDGEGGIVAEDRTVAPGSHATYRLAIPVDGEPVYLEEVPVDIPTPMPLTLRFVRSEDRGHTVRVSLVLATNDPATLEILDIQGRRMGRRAIGDLGSGEHDVRWPFGGAPGVYFLRLMQGREIRTSRVVVVR
jgi:hypothetical protein